MSTQAQSRKDQIISGLIDVRGQILQAASELSPAEQDQVFLGTWSVKDLLAHLVGWDYVNLEAAEAVQQGELLQAEMKDEEKHYQKIKAYRNRNP